MNYILLIEPSLKIKNQIVMTDLCVKSLSEPYILSPLPNLGHTSPTGVFG